MSGDDWERRTGALAGACLDCGTRQVAGEVYVAALRIKDGAMAREDRCEPCAEKSATEGVLGVWRAKVPSAKGPALRRLDFDTLVELFPRLDGRDDDASLRLRWVVALLLLRKKLLVQQSRETIDGGEVLTVKLKHDDRLFRVADPRMDDAALATLHEELGRIFDLAPGAKSAG